MNPRPSATSGPVLFARRLLAWVCLALWSWTAVAQGLEPTTPAAPIAAAPARQAGDDPAATLMLHNRKIAVFRATLLGDTPPDRAKMAHAALELALKSQAPLDVTRTLLGDAVRFEIDGNTQFFLTAADLGGPRGGAQLEAASQDVLLRLQVAVDEVREFKDPKSLAKGVAYSLAATVVAALLWRLLGAGRRRVTERVRRALQNEQGGGATGTLLTHYTEQMLAATRVSATALSWALALLLLDAWATYVLHQFAYTRPWGERSTAWLLEVLLSFVLAIAGAVPGLVTAILIFLLARLVSRAITAVLDKVERGETRYAWLDADTAMPTRRLSAVVVWLFALVMAYPYLPGANSEAFKGVTVLAGLMLSLGASSVVGQALSGLSLMYARALRVGEYVKVGDTEGTVVAIGMFTTKLHTGMGEEVSLPHTVIFGQPIRNFSRLVRNGSFMLHTSVTIGYATPWRQVHALLLDAAARTPGVATDPPPYVVQTALSDFYVEYRLCAQSNKAAPSRRIEAMNELHGNVLDVFNESGVQIMSPHYRSDPAEPQIVPPGDWASRPGPAKPLPSRP